MKTTTPNKISLRKRQTDHVCVLLAIPQLIILSSLNSNYKLSFYSSFNQTKMRAISVANYKSI